MKKTEETVEVELEGIMISLGEIEVSMPVVTTEDKFALAIAGAITLSKGLQAKRAEVLATVNRAVRRTYKITSYEAWSKKRVAILDRLSRELGTKSAKIGIRLIDRSYDRPERTVYPVSIKKWIDTQTEKGIDASVLRNRIVKSMKIEKLRMEVLKKIEAGKPVSFK